MFIFTQIIVPSFQETLLKPKQSKRPHKVCALLSHFAKWKYVNLILIGCGLEEDSCDYYCTLKWIPLCYMQEYGGRIADESRANIGKLWNKGSKDVFAKRTLCTVLCELPTASLIRSQAKISKQQAKLLLSLCVFFLQILSLMYLLSQHLFQSPFCLVSLQCDADSSQGGGMVEIGGVP